MTELELESPTEIWVKRYPQIILALFNHYDEMIDYEEGFNDDLFILLRKAFRK